VITHYYDGHKSITTLLLTVRQGALQEQGVDVSAALSLLSTAPSRILTNMAGKRDSVAGRGGVYHFGARYNYTGKESLGEQKLVPVAMQKREPCSGFCKYQLHQGDATLVQHRHPLHEGMAGQADL